MHRGESGKILASRGSDRSPGHFSPGSFRYRVRVPKRRLKARATLGRLPRDRIKPDLHSTLILQTNHYAGDAFSRSNPKWGNSTRSRS